MGEGGSETGRVGWEVSESRYEGRCVGVLV